MRVLGIDTSLRSTGLGVVEARGNRLSAVCQAVLKVPASQPLSTCLARIGAGITAVIERDRPDIVAIEGIFFCKNAKTAVILGEARGAAIAACAVRDLPVFEYAPRRVKQAVVGHGAAAKAQVRKMVMALLGLDTEPAEDAGDALAIAICHIHCRTRYEALQPKQI